MDPLEAALTVLREAGEPLHWTVIQDRALRAGYLDPFTDPQAIRTLRTALTDAARTGQLTRVAKGVYALAER
jgi:hypothetical protein